MFIPSLLSSFRRAFVTFVLVSLTVGSVGCATSASGQTRDLAAFGVEPFAPSPRLEITWRRGVDIAEIGDYRPQQFGGPLLMRKADRREIAVGTSTGRLYRMRAGNGEIYWSVSLDGPIHARPASDSDNLYVGTLKGAFYAIDRNSGDTVWKVDNERGIESPAAV